MQKIINVLAIASGVVSIAVVGSVGYVYVNKDAILASVKEQAMEAVMGNLGGGLGGAIGGGLTPKLPTGANDIAPNKDSASASAGVGALTIPSF